MRSIEDQADEDMGIAVEILNKAMVYMADRNGLPHREPLTKERVREACQFYQEAVAFGLDGLGEVTVATSAAFVVGLRQLGYRIVKA